MLKKIRLTLAVVFFAMTTLLFLDFTGTVHTWFGWMAKVQFLPAVLALNLGVVAFLVVLTLLVGRVYCSVICPLGVFQDIVSWISGRRKGKRTVFVFAGHQLVEIRSTGLVCSGYGGRFQLYCRTCGSIQRIRQNSIESVCAIVAVGKQSVGLCCRTYGQLCFL